MPTPAMTGDPNLQRYLSDQYHYYRDQGMSKHEAHSAAFQDMLQAKQQGFIPGPETPAEPDVLDVVYSDEPGL
jgi:hypothetical protein